MKQTLNHRATSGVGLSLVLMVGLLGAGSRSASAAEIVVSTLNAAPTPFLFVGPSREPVGGGSGGSMPDFYSGGQSLTAPAGATTLNEFSIVVQHQDFIPVGSPHGSEGIARVRGAVMEFAGSTAVGDTPLFLGPVIEIAPSGFVPQLITVDTGNLPVTAGTQYGLFLTQIDANAVGLFRLLTPLVGNLVGGTSILSDRAIATDAPSFAESSGDVWSHFVLGADIDTRFEARFNVVPEPSTVLAVIVPTALTLQRQFRSRRVAHNVGSRGVEVGKDRIDVQPQDAAVAEDRLGQADGSSGHRHRACSKSTATRDAPSVRPVA